MIEYPSHARARDAAPLRAVLSPGAVLIGAVLIASLALFVRPVTDTDFWLHVRVGQWIVDHGRLPAHDLFTYTVPDHRWVDHEYLSEVLLWLLQAGFGLAGASIGFGVLTWLGLVLVLAACRPRGQPHVVVALAVALGAAAGAPIWGARPQMTTFVLASLELLWLRRALDGSSRAILWLPLVMVLWSSLHGGWPVGFVFLGIALAVAVGRWLQDRPDAGRLARVRRLAIAGILSIPAVGLNPNGPAIYAYPFQTLTSAAQQGLILEWASPDFHLASLRAFELMVLLLVAGLALGRGPSAFDLLVALAGLALALESVRNVPLFVAAATPALVAAWSDAWRRIAPEALARRLPAGPARWAPAAGAAILAATAAAIGPGIAGQLAAQPGLTRQVVPVGAADWLSAHPDVGTRMFNQYAWGGYLAGRFYPDPNRRLFIVSEGVLMGDAEILRYRDVADLDPDWRSLLDQAGVDYVVFNRGSALAGALGADPGWRLVYQDSTAVIYVRAG
ncbi:MAG TPA: hypothetical protein VKF59_13595 [Candidatus Dormibacteraeota bacterium]|nr:hypothetical protein [Candidatus Dormibacteraeota bacterium]